MVDKGETEITLQIILIKPTPDVVFGLQKGSGYNYETVQKQIPAFNDLTFTFTIKVKGDRSKDKLPILSGSFVQVPLQINSYILISAHMLAKLLQLGRGDLKFL